MTEIKQIKTLKYSQLSALLAMTKASFLANFRSAQALFFGFAFPVIFISIFGLLGQGSISISVAVLPGSDVDNPIYQALAENETFDLKTDLTQEEIDEDLSIGRLDGALFIRQDAITQDAITQNRQLEVEAFTTSASNRTGIFVNTVNGIVNSINTQFYQTQLAELSGAVETRSAISLEVENVEGREYRQIDFILPGQLAFALLSTGVFGTAFSFLNLRKTFVLKRFFATPVSKFTILAGEAISRLVIAVIQAVVIIGFGSAFFSFTLVNGFVTFVSLLLLSVIGLIVFLGLGLVITNLAKTEASVSSITNLVTLPQFILSGAFFDVALLPEWIQPVSRILPMTYLNDALRKIAFEGAGIAEISLELVVLLGWMVVLYFFALRLFRWE